MKLETVQRRWHDDRPVIVAAPGPSLAEEVAQACRGYRTIAVQDACRRLPWADVLYGCESAWWRVREGCLDFRGERWSTHDTGSNDKRAVTQLYGMRLVAGKPGDTFSTDPAVIHYGTNSGFQAVNLAVLLGATNIVLVGFDMRRVNDKAHFFGDHKKPLRVSSSYATFIRAFAAASKAMPPGVRIVNATPSSALTCFPMVPLEQALCASEAA